MNESQYSTERPMNALKALRARLRWGLAPRMIGLIILAAIVSGGLVGIALTYTSRNELRRNVLDSNLAHADLAAQYASNYVKAIQAGVRSFASRASVVGAVLDNRPEQVKDLLVEFLQIQSAMDSVNIYDEKGIARVSGVIESQNIGLSHTDREWYQQVMATGKPYLGIPVRSRVTGRPSVPYAVPILDKTGKIRGILTGGISLASLSDAIVRSPIARDARASMNDLRNDGIIVVHSDPKRILNPVSGRNEAHRFLTMGQRGTIETLTSDGDPSLIAYAVVPDLPWGILVIQPSRAALATVTVLTRRAGFLIFLSILFTAVLGGLWALKVTRPLILLRDASGELAGGDLTRRVRFLQRDEIGDLGRAFDRMAQTLSDKEEQLRAYAADLERRVVERTAELEAGRETLKKNALDLQRSNADLERLAYVASHDLQEPLRMIVSYMQLIERRYRDRLDADGRTFMQYAVDGAARMQDLIADLLTYARVGYARGLTFKPTNMKEVAARASENLKMVIDETGAVITCDEALPVLMADSSQMLQLFQNLLANAVKFCGKDPPAVHVGAAMTDEGWRFSVRDNGIGIEMKYAERIFTIFQRLQRREAYRGTGTGLAIAKRIVENHGGRIWVESSPGEGSTFYFTMPIQGGTRNDQRKNRETH